MPDAGRMVFWKAAEWEKGMNAEEKIINSCPNMKERAKTVMLVFGTRPEAVKMCPLILELKKKKENQNRCCCYRPA